MEKVLGGGKPVETVQGKLSEGEGEGEVESGGRDASDGSPSGDEEFSRGERLGAEIPEDGG